MPELSQKLRPYSSKTSKVGFIFRKTLCNSTCKNFSTRIRNNKLSVRLSKDTFSLILEQQPPGYFCSADRAEPGMMSVDFVVGATGESQNSACTPTEDDNSSFSVFKSSLCWCRSHVDYVKC